MSTPAAAAVTAKPVRITRKQLLSLFGLVPLGVYVVLHLWTNLYALAGAKAFDDRLAQSRDNPILIVLEVFGLGFPILFHTIAGFMEIGRARPNNTSYNTFDNLKFVLQRLSAIGLALFIGAHVYMARIRPAISPDEYTVNGHETFAGMHHVFTEEPITLIVYALGLLGVSYHLANGLYTAGIRWGLAISPSGRSRLQVISAAAFLALIGMSYAALYGFMQNG